MGKRSGESKARREAREEARRAIDPTKPAFGGRNMDGRDWDLVAAGARIAVLVAEAHGMPKQLADNILALCRTALIKDATKERGKPIVEMSDAIAGAIVNALNNALAARIRPPTAEEQRRILS